MPTLCVAGHALEYQWFDPPHAREAESDAILVFLHEGLGSLAMWKDFPAQVALATGCRALVYSRQGYGKSAPLSTPRTVRYMHDEALIALPELLHQLHIRNPILIGHSDGASIALIHAAQRSWPVRALVLLAPHVFVEQLTVDSIAKAKIAYQGSDLPVKLGRYHDDVDGAFWGWNQIWLDPAFRHWNIESGLSKITCPVLAIQGEDDEYGTMAQVESIARQTRQVRVIQLGQCRP
ncbi:MAG: alpha/beta fold hydrolase, partial [Rhodoferax sp.]